MGSQEGLQKLENIQRHFCQVKWQLLLLSRV